MKINFNNVIRISVTPARLASYDGSHWKDGRIIIEDSSGNVDELFYSSDHFSDPEDVKIEVTTDVGADVLKENQALRARLAELQELLGKDF